MATGFTQPIVNSPRSRQAAYSYRTGIGMVPSAEWDVFFDDFHSFIVATAITNGPVANTPWGWQGAVIDTGATAVVDTTAALGASGVLLLSDATASEGIAIYGTKSLQLTSGKKFMMECRVRTDDVSDNTLYFGLSDLTATTNPEDLWTTAAANLVAFGILDAGTPAAPITGVLTDASNAGTALATGTRSLVASTWHILGIHYDGVGVGCYVDGKLSVYTTTTIPTGVAMAPFFGARNGNGAGGNNNYFDFIRWSLQR